MDLQFFVRSGTRLKRTPTNPHNNAKTQSIFSLRLRALAVKD